MIEPRTQPGFLWIGSYGRGLYRINLTTRSLAHFSSASSSSPRMQNDFAWGLFEDKWGTLWATSLTAGLHKIHTRNAWVSHFAFESKDKLYDGVPLRIWEDPNGLIWHGKEDAIYLLNPKTGNFEPVGAPFKQIGSSFGYPERISMLKEDILLHTDQNEFVFYNPAAATVKAVKNDLISTTELPNQIITEGFEGASGNIWFGGENGALLKYEPDGGDIETVLYIQEQNIFKVLFEDSKGRIWCELAVDTETVRMNLVRVDPSNRTYEFLDLNNMYANGIVEDQQGTFWIGTSGSGLYKYDPFVKRTSIFTVQDGLTSNSVAGPLIDEEGVLWFISGSTLTRFEPDTAFFTSTDLTKIFEDYPESSNSSETFKSRDGTLYFGNESGLLQVNPELFASDSLAPSIVFTDFKINNLSVPIAEDYPLKSHISVTEEVVLTHNDNDITLEFAALDFENPQENTYSYLLDNYDDTWIDSGTQRTATYTNLDPGEYTFRVKGANSRGIWNETGASIVITILPPWWRTTAAFVVYGLLFVVGVVGIDRFQRRRIVSRERLRAEREKAKAIESTNNELNRALKHLTETQDQLIHTEKMASLGQLTAGIAHEIKNPLNFVNNFSRLSEGAIDELKTWIEENGGMDDPDVRELVDTLKMNSAKINEHGQRADAIIRSMLEHSRTGRGERRATHLNKLVEEYVNLAYHGARAREHGFEVDLKLNVDDAIEEVEIYPQEIGRVLINLFDNAFYTVNEKRLSLNGTYAPQVSVSTKRSDGFVEVQVIDNGMGIPADIQKKIFEPFFTTKPTGSGTGLGLSLSHDIVTKGHGGTITVESQKGEGTTFVVSIPCP